MFVPALPSAPRILVVGDEDMERRLCDALVGEAAEIRRASAEDATLPTSFDVVVLAGSDGLGAWERWRAGRSDARPPILFVLPMDGASNGIGKRATDAGADDVIAGAAARHDLGSRVRLLVRLGRLEAELRQHRLRAGADAELIERARRQREDLATVIHDLENPIAGVIANAQYIESSDGLDEEVMGSVRDILSGAESMHRLLKNLLDLGREGGIPVTLERCDLSVLVEGAMRVAAIQISGGAPDAVVAIEDRARFVRADAALLPRVLETLLEHCLRHGAPQGRLSILGVPIDGGERVELRVAVEGLAVPAAARDALAAPNAAHRHAPSVIGNRLAFCAFAAARQGGEIFLRDDPPRGLSLCLRLAAE